MTEFLCHQLIPRLASIDDPNRPIARSDQLFLGMNA
jgi:hypothetical protein